MTDLTTKRGGANQGPTCVACGHTHSVQAHARKFVAAPVNQFVGDVRMGREGGGGGGSREPSIPSGTAGVV